MKNRVWVVVLIIFFIKPRYIEIGAIWIKLARAVLARLVLDMWISSTTIISRVANRIHRWLRAQGNGQVAAYMEELRVKVNLPDGGPIPPYHHTTTSKKDDLIG